MALLHFLSILLALLTPLDAQTVLIFGADGRLCGSGAIEESKRDLATLEQGFLGKEKLDPTSETFKFLRDRILRKVKDVSDLPQIPHGKLTDLSALKDAGGLGNSGILKAMLNGRSVVIKKAPRELVKESRWFMVMNKMGLGPEFHGITILEDGTPGIVTEFLDGAPFSYNSDASKLQEIELTAKMERQVRATGTLLHQAGITYAPDLQFMLTRDGRAVVIDPEYFELAPPLVPKIGAPGDPRQNAKITADRLAQLMAILGTGGRSAPPRKEGSLILP